MEEQDRAGHFSKGQIYIFDSLKKEQRTDDDDDDDDDDDKDLLSFYDISTLAYYNFFLIACRRKIKILLFTNLGTGFRLRL